MGLCKCPRKRMTNLFCFEHHVNVCEECLVHDHSKCIIKSYLNWLEDSDYDASCPLCHRPLVEGECARLVCYHLYHWVCLNRYASQLPLNTAPAGYKCSTCAQGIFPKSNLATPVADALRRQLETVNWGRAGLGLPLFGEDGSPMNGTTGANFVSAETSAHSASSHTLSGEVNRETTISFESRKDAIPEQKYERETVRRTGDNHDSRTNSFIMASSRQNSTLDSDNTEVKYKRKPFGDWFARLLRYTFRRAYMPRPSANDAKAGMRRLFITVLVVIVMLLTFGVFMTSVNRSPYEEADVNLEHKLDGIRLSADGQESH